jgi:hypothetical protein
MSLERSRLVYRCVLVVDLLLSVAFIVLSGIALGQQQETFFRKMVDFGAIAYFVFATTLLCIAIWATREYSIFAAFRHGDDRDSLSDLPALLVFITIMLVLCFLIMSLIKFEYSEAVLFLVLLISPVHLFFIVIALLIDKGISDDKWRSLGQYTALGDDVPVVHHTADTPNQ